MRKYLKLCELHASTHFHTNARPYTRTYIHTYIHLLNTDLMGQYSHANASTWNQWLWRISPFLIYQNYGAIVALSVPGYHNLWATVRKPTLHGNTLSTLLHSLPYNQQTGEEQPLAWKPVLFALAHSGKGNNMIESEGTWLVCHRRPRFAVPRVGANL